jgi:hypothetical protein
VIPVRGALKLAVEKNALDKAEASVAKRSKPA